MKPIEKNQKNETILNFVSANPKSDNAQIVKGTNLGKETVRLALIKLAEDGKVSFEVVENKKKLFSTPAPKKAVVKVAPKKAAVKKVVAKVAPKKVAKPRKVKQELHASVPTVLILEKKLKNRKPAVVKTKFGLGLIFDHEPQVTVKKGIHGEFEMKTIVHLVKDDMTPRTMNGQPKKMLTTKVTIITPSVEDKPVRVKGEKRAKGEPSAKDFSKFKFQGELYSKGRLIHAIIAKFAADNNPTIVELNAAFPQNVVKAYGKGLFLSVEEAEKINTDSKRSRFFTKKEDIIKIKGLKIAVSNQIDGELVNRMLTVTPKHGYKITSDSAPVVKPTNAKAADSVATLPGQFAN